MKKALSDVYKEAKNLPKGLWLAAAIVPFGFVTITVYIAGKTAYEKIQQERYEFYVNNNLIDMKTCSKCKNRNHWILLVKSVIYRKLV